MEKWFDYKSSPFKLFSKIKLNNKIPEITDLINISTLFNLNIHGDDLYDELGRFSSVCSTFINDSSLSSAEKWCTFFKGCEDVQNFKLLYKQSLQFHVTTVTLNEFLVLWVVYGHKKEIV